MTTMKMRILWGSSRFFWSLDQLFVENLGVAFVHAHQNFLKFCMKLWFKKLGKCSKYFFDSFHHFGHFAKKNVQNWLFWPKRTKNGRFFEFFRELKKGCFCFFQKLPFLPKIDPNLASIYPYVAISSLRNGF